MTLLEVKDQPPFLNVGLDIEDRDVTRFFWLSKPKDPNSDLITYRFKSVLFGATCSPFILNAVLSKHLNNHSFDFTEKLTRDLYVDNIISSFESEEELLKYFKLVRSLFADGGFNLRSWASNSQLLQVLARTENVMDKDQLIKILGLRWDTTSDTLGFVTPNLDISELITKREVLRQSSRIYDPLGILSPITVRSKMLMQNIWEKNFNWDELLPDSTITEWMNIRKDIQEATKTVVPRHYFDESSDTNNDNVIHVFTDSSMKAYGACAYIVANGKSSLIMAKNRVAPLKQLTIPRLELMAAVIGSRLLAHIRNTLQITRAVLWSDSQIVLTWLSSKKTLKPFISNRVKEITKLTEELTWRYCPSESNPADVLSRGITIDKFKDNRLWMHGPDWLTEEDNWPEWHTDEAIILSTIAQQEVVVDTVQATQNKFTMHMIQGIGNVIDLNKFNSFKKLLRITAYLRRFITNCRTRAIQTGLSSTVTLLRQTYWIPSIRQVIKSIIHKCVICQKVTGRPYLAPDPPPLPKDRLTEAPPFTVTGVDFTGALNVKTTDGLTSKKKLNNFGTTWKFIPKRAPWYGGFWERLIGLTKNCIKKVLGRSLIQIELLRTIVTEVEAILNDRPLKYVSSDPLDEPLTPSHLLYGRRITSLPYPTNQELEHSQNDMTHKSTNKLFKMKTQIIQSFWYKWKHEYLTALREYHRNTGNNKQLVSIGDVVQIYDDSPRIKWTLAVVEKLNVGGDGLARSAVIRTKNGLTSRPITKLYPLEVSLNSDNDNSDCATKTCRKARMVAMEKIKK
ncbi:uncharacterized protein [Mytilus edulis]|uniref:uncharacterized protein n=1 Tax=Mytilus edulis TaxID=6550 RepID=UPI0039EE8C0A